MDENTDSGEYSFPGSSSKTVKQPDPFNNDNMEINQGFREIVRPSRNVNERSYKCPKCEGEFNQWDKESSKDSFPNTRRTEKYVCPFCGLPRQEYNPEEE